jgi:hypothetical protein
MILLIMILEFYEFKLPTLRDCLSTMSSPPTTLLTPLQSLSSKPEHELPLTPTSRDIHREALAAKIASQRAKILALEHEAEVRRRDGQLRVQDQPPRVVTEEDELVSSPLTFLPTPSSSGYHST